MDVRFSAVAVRIALFLLLAVRVGAQPLEEHSLANLVTFARATGAVRYFHPASQNTDWNAFTAAAVDEVERASDVHAVLTRLYPPVDARANPFFTRVVRWEHHGVQTGALAPSAEFRSERVTSWRIGIVGVLMCIGLALVSVVLAMRTRRAWWLLGVAFALPLLLPRGELETWRMGAFTMPLELPASVADAHPPFRATGAITPRAQRLASVISIWNVQQQFYPYFDQVEVDWPAALRRALRKAAVDRDDAEFLRTLRMLGHDLKDSHAWVKKFGESSLRLPVSFAWIEDRLVVTGVASTVTGIRVGDVVQSIDGVPARDAVQREFAITPGSHRDAAWYLAANFSLAYSTSAKTARITLEDGSTHELTYGKVRPKPRYEPIAEVAPGVLRVDLGTANPELFRAALPRLEKARAIVFALEIYPSAFPEPIFLQHLFDEPFLFWKMQVPVNRRPDQAARTWLDLPDETHDALEPRLRAKVAFVVTPLTVSYAEHVVDAVQFHKRGIVVGEPTAGAFGSYNFVEVPGRIRFDFTGGRANRLDGSVLHGRGVIPDVRATRTIAGVREGRDEVLEAAIAALSGVRRP